MKYGIRDHRGGGRSSGRETVGRVAAGAIAMKILKQHGITISGRILEVHGKTSDKEFEREILAAKEAGDSVGGIAEITAHDCPAGFGDPVFGKLDAQIASAMMGIGAVKGVEIGDGFAAARRTGSENNDPMTAAGFTSNYAGGILGGISTGQDIVVRIAVKPTPSISKVQHTRDVYGNDVDIAITGRHDPCIVPRILPVAEAMLALVMYDCMLEQKKYQ
jgi:chorismate synthase